MKQVCYNFSGQNFVVSGASSGIGRQVVLDLAAAGAVVLGLARRSEALEELRAMAPENIKTTCCDVCNKGSIETAVGAFVAEHGKVHGCVHAAGNLIATPLRSYDAVAAHSLMETHFWGGVLLLQCCTRSQYAVKGTSSVVLSSIDAKVASKSLFAYASAKAALATAVKTFAKELAPKGHRVVSVSPGWVATELTQRLSEFAGPVKEEVYPLGVGQPEDVANLILFLLSDNARWISGTDIVIDGGFLA
ncbi:SDR family NAD(P)-dependent oxidoreductase [Desulfovibrio cuneatus]|uniref:SDR family NAD(P)-dependent oxidoreductase n=1 Tax=Desulfovibrio cuneatus TaxID=159728 RepID=UPI00040276E1|nr:SDR family oxidoreductase [Desulfovibrio cuneatus]